MKAARTGENPSTAVERVRDEVLAGLSEGRYVPGQRLIAAELAAKLGTSQIPVREALHILSGCGVVDLIPRKGARICELSAREFLNFLDVWGPICRLNYSTAADRLADPDAKRRWRQELDTIDTILDDLHAAANDRIAIDFFRSYMRLYHVCAAINDNPYFLKIRTVLPVELYYRHVADILPGPLWDEYHANIGNVIESIAAGDRAAFLHTWESHMTLITDYLRRAFEKRE